MAIENTYLTGSGVQLGTSHFDLQAQKPLDSRTTVPAYAGLQALIDGKAAYEGMIVYDEETKKTYQAQKVDGVLKFREFGINESELKDLIASETTAAMEFKGAATALPENPAKGDMYKVTAAFKVGEEDVKVGDSIVYDGEQWFIIPSGDDIEDTWRPITDVANDATLTFAAGDKLDVSVASNGTITYSHEAIDAPELLAENEQTRTYITAVETDGYGHITGYKTATENVEDTNTTYEFEGLPVGEDETAPSSVYFQVKASDAEAAEVIYLDAYNKNEADTELAKKVDKVEGHSLVSDTEIARLAEVDNYDDKEVRGLIGDNAQAIEDLETYVGAIPYVKDESGNNKYADLDVIGYINKKAQETLAAASGNSSETAASVKQQLDDHIGAYNTRVKAVEDNIDAIEEEVAGVKATAEAAATKTYTDEELAKKLDKVTYEAYIEGKSMSDEELKAYAEAQAAAAQDAANQYYNDNISTDLTSFGQSVDNRLDTIIGNIEDNTDSITTISDFVGVAANVLGESSNLVEYVDDKTEGIAGRVTTVEGDVATIKANYLDGEDKTELEGKITTGDEATLTSAKAYADEIATAASKALSSAVEDLNGEISGQVGGVYQEVQDLSNIVTNLSQCIGSTDNGELGEAANLIEYIDAKNSATDTKVNGIDERLIAAEGDVATIKNNYLKAADKTALQEQITANANAINVITNGIDAEKIDGLNDLIEWADEHAPEVKSIKEDIEANTKAIGDEATRADAAEKLLAGRLDILEAIEHEAYKAADTALHTAISNEIDADVAAAKAEAITEASNQDAVVLSEAQTFAEGKVAELAGKVYEKEEVYTKAEVESLLCWGSF